MSVTKKEASSPKRYGARPYSVILFDEIEKAHPDVFNVLLQILDDGRATDSQGRTVDFRNTVIIMTSNVGSANILEGMGGGGDWADVERTAIGALQQTFRPEFLNRVDDVIVYRPLDEMQLRHVVDLQVATLVDRVSKRGITLEVADTAKEYLARVGYDPAYGARPLKRAIQRELENPAAMALLDGGWETGDVIRVEQTGNELQFQRVRGDADETRLHQAS